MMDIDRNIDYCSDCYNKANGIDENMNQHQSLTETQRFYDGKNILITGGTGFLGKILLEKLLRRCQGIENIYLLVRQKRGKDIYTRMEEIFDDPVFERLKQEVPKFRHKVVVVPADCEAAGLGITLSDRQMLTEKVNIIFHSAATVKFDEHMRAALAINVHAPLHLLRLARDMKALDVMMHISTAYSNSHLTRIEEKFYPCNTDCDKLQTIVDKLSDEQIEDLLPSILGPWPNTYTFTKALAEQQIRVNANGLPIAIFRPAIVTSTAKEPLKCWVDNMYGPTGVAVGTASGMLRVLQCGEDVSADIVPVDSVVNCLMVAAVDVHKSYKQSSPPLEPPIFNYVSSTENRITWGEFKAYNLEAIHNNPFSDAVWYFSLILTKSSILYGIYKLLLHIIPAIIVDGLTICLGRKPKMLKVYRKIHKFSSVLAYFATSEISFCNKRTRDLWHNTAESDRVLFPFSMSEIDWKDYFSEYLHGIRRYLFKDSDDTLPQARIKWKRLFYLHQIVRFVFYVLTLYVLWRVFSTLL